MTASKKSVLRPSKVNIGQADDIAAIVVAKTQDVIEMLFGEAMTLAANKTEAC